MECCALQKPMHGFFNCSNPSGNYAWNSSCNFSCEEGFVLKGPDMLQCGASGEWDGQEPICEGEGFILLPYLHSQRVAVFLCSVLWPYMGWFTARSASISVVKCQAVPQSEGSLMNCSHHDTELKYKSTCDFACAKGYTLRGSPQIQCLSDGHWSQPIPVCEGKRQRSDSPVIYFGYRCYMHARIHFSYLS